MNKFWEYMIPTILTAFITAISMLIGKDLTATIIWAAVFTFVIVVLTKLKEYFDAKSAGKLVGSAGKKILAKIKNKKKIPILLGLKI